jgi:hypothetical protein
MMQHATAAVGSLMILSTSRPATLPAGKVVIIHRLQRHRVSTGHIDAVCQECGCGLVAKPQHIKTGSLACKFGGEVVTEHGKQ